MKFTFWIVIWAFIWIKQISHAFKNEQRINQLICMYLENSTRVWRASLNSVPVRTTRFRIYFVVPSFFVHSFFFSTFSNTFQFFAIPKQASKLCLLFIAGTGFVELLTNNDRVVTMILNPFDSCLLNKKLKPLTPTALD